MSGDELEHGRQTRILAETEPNANDANAEKLERIICRVNNALFLRGAWTVHNMV